MGKPKHSSCFSCLQVMKSLAIAKRNSGHNRKETCIQIHLASDPRTEAGEFIVDAVSDKQLALKGCPVMPLDIGNIAAAKQPSNTDENRPGTPPHDVIGVVATTIVTTMGAYKNETTNLENEPSSSEPAARDTKATIKRPLLPQPSPESKKKKGD